MIKGISYWSLRDGLANTHPREEALREVRAAGFEAMELSIGDSGVLTVESSEADCRKARELIDRSGVHVSTAASGLSWGTNPVSNDPAVRARSLDLTTRALERTAWLGCEALLYVPGVVGCPFVPTEQVRYDRALDRCRENVARLLETAERVGVDLCIENVWNGMFLSPLELAGFIDSFKSDHLGVYFDVGNVLGYHQHPPHWIELLGTRIKRVHVKDFKHVFGWQGSYDFCRLAEGDVPWRETIAALRAVGYNRTVIAEMLPHTPGIVEHTSRALDQILSR